MTGAAIFVSPNTHIAITNKMIDKMSMLQYNHPFLFFIHIYLLTNLALAHRPMPCMFSPIFVYRLMPWTIVFTVWLLIMIFFVILTIIPCMLLSIFVYCLMPRAVVFAIWLLIMITPMITTVHSTMMTLMISMMRAMCQRCKSRRSCYKTYRQ